MGNNPLSGVIFAIEEACKMSACKVIQIKIMLSILTDTEKQRNIDLQEVNAGLMPEWKYKVKWQGMSEEEAKRDDFLTFWNSVPEYSKNSLLALFFHFG